MKQRRRVSDLRRLGQKFALILLLLGHQTTIGQEMTASDLIAFLTYQSGRQGKEYADAGMFSCADYDADRAAAASLAVLGQPAVGEIERAIRSMGPPDRGSDFALGLRWLIAAYAQIKGADAYPVILKMAIDSGRNLDDALALSLGLTSYVSTSRTLGSTIHCMRNEYGPFDPLNLLILAWEQDNQSSFESSLGPAARASLDALLNRQTWADVRSELWRGKAAERSAVGYTFKGAGRWSSPLRLAKREDWDWRSDNDVTASLKPELVTSFLSASGRHCGDQTISFSSAPSATQGGRIYLVNTDNVPGLLSLISGCASRK
jgi:hypothetical protein